MWKFQQSAACCAKTANAMPEQQHVAKMDTPDRLRQAVPAL
jgi:hypothetical protein